jgi:hypothetical protein
MLGMSSLSCSSLLQGHSCRKRSATSKVAPPHISRLPAGARMADVAGAALSMSCVRMRVAIRDWCASRLRGGGGGGEQQGVHSKCQHKHAGRDQGLVRVTPEVGEGGRGGREGGRAYSSRKQHVSRHGVPLLLSKVDHLKCSPSTTMPMAHCTAFTGHTGRCHPMLITFVLGYHAVLKCKTTTETTMKEITKHPAALTWLCQ